uniref:Haloacid dehalogenase n=1 Tax=uncultured Thiotrichaceae bacterium TaxID=298394 RepID=A0A6S6TI58_9GAMM|nr:MAG: Haloacid dehalogenase [uncultured Thiotrichaceae bacterium]
MPEKIIMRDWKRVQQFLEAEISSRSVTTVSLDVFDTLLARIDTPEQVQRAVCRLLADKVGAGCTADQVWLARQQAERQLREQAAANGLDYECRFSELVPAWVEALTDAVDDELVEFVTATEIELEKQALYVKSGVREFLAWLSKQGIRVIAISDMYLDGYLLDDLLVDKYLDQYFGHTFVSADTGLCKYSGRLFKGVAEQLSLKLDDSWVHIGDNPVSDRRVACEVGIQGVLLYEKDELRRREQQQLSVDMAARGSVWKGQHFFSVLQQRMNSIDSIRDHDDFYFRYGRDVLGGAFSAFTLGLHERLQKQSVDKLFFVARDGFMFQQLYRQLDEAVEDEYIYLSRKVITAASTANGLTQEQAQVAFYNPKQQGLRSVCKVYGLPEDDLMPLATQHGFSDFSEPIHDWHDPRLLNFLADDKVQACIKPVGRKHRDLLEEYLEQVGFLGNDNVVLVDIGWNGTVQKFLKQAFGHRKDFPQVQGYYFAFVPKMYNDFGSKNFCEGIIHDSRRDNACERIPAEFEEIFEQGARAQGATTIAYQRVDGKVAPVFKSEQAADRKAEVECNSMVAAMQEGAMAHWKQFLLVQRLTGYSSQDLLPYVYGQLERAIVYPTKEETQMLTQLVHTEDFGDDHILDLGQRTLSWGDLLKPLQLWQRLRLSAWRYAMFAGIPTGVANFMVRMAYLHAVKK